ncbi:MAG: hypothetical protein ACK559_23275, partial [bacterium]
MPTQPSPRNQTMVRNEPTIPRSGTSPAAISSCQSRSNRQSATATIIGPSVQRAKRTEFYRNSSSTICGKMSASILHFLMQYIA